MALVNEKEEEEDAEKALKGEFIEEEPAGLSAGVKIKHLAKVTNKPIRTLFPFIVYVMRVNIFPFPTEIQSWQQDPAGCAGSHSEHV